MAFRAIIGGFDFGCFEDLVMDRIWILWSLVEKKIGDN